MADGKITTESVAPNVAEGGPIILRQSDERRLVFLTAIVDRPEAPVRGIVVWQRKRKADEWDDITGETLNSLKAGEGFKLELKSGEVALLLQGIEDRKGIYEKHGISFGQREYVAEAELPEIVRTILAQPELQEALRALDPADLLSLGQSVDVSKLDALLSEWNENADNDDEDFWQDLFTRSPWVFSQLTGSPVVLLEERAYGVVRASRTSGGATWITSFQTRSPATCR